MGSTPIGRDNKLCSELQRNTAAGFGLESLNSNFETTVGLQHRRIKNSEDLIEMLHYIGGGRDGVAGRPCVPDLNTLYQNTIEGRKEFCGHPSSLVGSYHPLAVEVLCNTKTRSGLAFGLVDPATGQPLSVCAEQLDPATYWSRADGAFTRPKVNPDDIFWISTSRYWTSVFDHQLPRPLTGSVVPGDHLARLFLQRQVRRGDARQATGVGAPARHEWPAWLVRDTKRECEECDVCQIPVELKYLRLLAHDIESPSAPIRQATLNDLRSIGTGQDAEAARDAESVKRSVNPYDMMRVRESLGVKDFTDVQMRDAGDKEFTLSIKSKTKQVAGWTGKIHATIFSPWDDACKKALVELRAMTDCDDASDGCDGEAFATKRQLLYERYSDMFGTLRFKIKRDIAHYHLRNLEACFSSKVDRSTIPPGYVRMYESLMEGIRQNGGSLSVAFNGGEKRPSGCGRVGRELICTGRSVYGHVHEWLRVLFVDICRIDGRDRRLMVRRHDPRAPTPSPPPSHASS